MKQMKHLSTFQPPHWHIKSLFCLVTKGLNANEPSEHLTAVEGRLSPHGQQDAIRTFNLDDIGYKFGCDGQEVDRVGLFGAHLVGLNRGDVGIHKHRFQVLLLQRHTTIYGDLRQLQEVLITEDRQCFQTQRKYQILLTCWGNVEK